jgi:HD-like signal output (HDOD) protein
MDPTPAHVQRFFPATLVLPTLPEVATRLLRTFGDENTNLGALVELIGQDPALAAKVLRLANSARYSSSRGVATLRDAAAVLGTSTLRNLTMAACVAGAFPDVDGLDRARFWRHGMATARHAVQLAQAANIDTEMAYLAGLMLRSGQLLMAMQDRAVVTDIEAHVTEAGSRFGWEATRLQCTHSDVTAELARRWKFPAALVQAFVAAGEPMEAQPFSVLGAVLHLAEVLADATDLQLSPRDALETAAPRIVAHLNLDLDWLVAQQVSDAALEEDLAHAA